MAKRSYDLEVVAKWEGTHGFGTVYLRAPSVNGVPLDLNRPWWVEKGETGAPLTLALAPDEMAAVEVGTLYRVTLEQVPG